MITPRPEPLRKDCSEAFPVKLPRCSIQKTPSSAINHPAVITVLGFYFELTQNGLLEPVANLKAQTELRSMTTLGCLNPKASPLSSQVVGMHTWVKNSSNDNKVDSKLRTIRVRSNGTPVRPIIFAD